MQTEMNDEGELNTRLHEKRNKLHSLFLNTPFLLLLFKLFFTFYFFTSNLLFDTVLRLSCLSLLFFVQARNWLVQFQIIFKDN